MGAPRTGHRGTALLPAGLAGDSGMNDGSEGCYTEADDLTAYVAELNPARASFALQPAGLDPVPPGSCRDGPRGLASCITDVAHALAWMSTLSARCTRRAWASDNLFMHPCTEIESVERDLTVSRLAATSYLDALAAGLLQELKAGRSKCCVKRALNEIPTRRKSTEAPRA